MIPNMTEFKTHLQIATLGSILILAAPPLKEYFEFKFWEGSFVPWDAALILSGGLLLLSSGVLMASKHIFNPHSDGGTAVQKIGQLILFFGVATFSLTSLIFAFLSFVTIIVKLFESLGLMSS